MSDYIVSGNTLSAIADAIRAKTGQSAPLTPAQMPDAIGSISGGSVVTETLNVPANGTYNAQTGKAWDKVVAAVPNSYGAGDEGKVVASGALVAQTAHATVIQNGTYDTTTNNSVTVNVSGGELISSATHLGNLFATEYSKPLPSSLPPENLIINAPNCYNISGLCKQYVASSAYNVGIKTVTFAALRDMASLSGFIDISQAFYRNTSVKTVDFGMAVVPVTGTGFATDAAELESIIGTLKYNTNSTSGTAGTTDFRAAKLRDVSFYPGCLLNSMTFTSPYLTDASLVSIANGLDGTQTDKTLTHNATAKTRCGQIVGTVTDGVFAIDVGGSVTLTDFITQTKGWTLA